MPKWQQSFSWQPINLPVVARRAKSGAHQGLKIYSESATIRAIRGENQR
jgi:hypothetical protein